MPSITYWNRLEPRARSTDLANALAARVRDPAWLLARQWQLGEFAGADGGSPAYVRLSTTVAPFGAWSTASGSPVPLASGVPIECAATAEGASPDDLALAVQLGQTFDRFLVDAQATDVRPAFLAAFPIAATSPAFGEDPMAARLRAIWHGRAIDGIALYRANAVPAAVSGPRRQAAASAVAALAAWVPRVVGEISAADPLAWRAPQLDYDVRVYAASPAAPTGSSIALAATPDRDGDLSWHAFDAAGAAPANAALPAATTTPFAVIPGPVRFRGMPNERFWDFEDGRVEFGAMAPDRRGLASLIVMDFMLVHGNDWFLVPLELPVGTVCASALTVVDVFGQPTEIPRADAVAATTAASRRWTMFSTSDASGAPVDFITLPASAAGVVGDGPPLEEVRFLRDDIAGIAWAVERSVEGSLGTPWLAADRAPPSAAPPTPAAGTLAYRIQSDVPAQWIPFVPTKLGGEVALERAALLSLSGTAPTLPVPLGRILEPTQLGSGRYRLREEQVPREGLRVVRRARRARGVDGSTHVWVARAKSAGTGEGWSGLRFDLADE